MTDQLVLKVGGRLFAGWTEIEVVRGIEQMPNTFRISATEASPIASAAVMVQPAAPCSISLGGDLVLTGYVDTVSSGYSAGVHKVTLAGRGKCQDLVDCSVEWPNLQMSSAPALQIAQRLAKPYGITVKNLGPAGPVVLQFNMSVGETPASVIEHVCRWAQLLYYEDPQGNLVLAQAGISRAGSGFAEGQNVQAASYLNSMAGRYSDYLVSIVSVDSSPLIQDGDNDSFYVGRAYDPNVPRHRMLATVADFPGPPDLHIPEKQALWRANRLAGRGQQVSVTVDSWRDALGKLWEPNTLAPVSLPRLKFKHSGLCIAEVIYRLGPGGRTADLLLMAKEAFLPEPIIQQPFLPGLVVPSAGPSLNDGDLGGGGAGGPSPN